MKTNLKYSSEITGAAAFACLLFMLGWVIKNSEAQESLTIQFFLIGLSALFILLMLFRKSTLLKKRNLTAKDEIFISNEWFRKTLLSMGEAVIATDKKGTVTSMNTVAEELTGYKMTESQSKPIDNIFNAIDEHSLLQTKNPIYKALAENRLMLLANHTILIKKDKTERYIVDSAAPIHNEHDEVVGGVLIFRDVTEQTLSKKKLIESEGLLMGIMRNTNLVVYIKDLDGKYLLLNHQKEKVYNIKASELIGKNTIGHLSKEDADMSRRTDKQAINNKQLVEFEQAIRHADGTIHSYHTSKFPLYDEEHNVYAVCSVSTDISESKKNIEMNEKLSIQAVLLKSEMRYDELTENMPNMFFSLDHNLVYTSFNKACEKFTALKAEDVIGKKIKEMMAGTTPLFLTEYKEVIETGKAVSFVSTFIFNESPYIFIVNIYPTEKGISILMTDLTREKKSERATLELVDNLQKKNKDLRLFAYTVSHDLRAPIARVIGLIHLAGTNPEFKINDKTILENVASEVASLDDVVKDMNTIISVRDEGKQKEYISFKTELNLIIKVLENEILESRAMIIDDFEHAEGITTVKSYLYSIMFNLLSNAIKYRSNERELIIRLKTEEDNGLIQLSVKDNGMGIDMKKNGDKVFGLYNRFHGKIIDGKGIGLNLVKTQAESLGGKVEVESIVNEGSTFKIFLPVPNNIHAAG
ncbi:MAG: PAS domain S-box protein [Bacteroidota bacterium]